MKKESFLAISIWLRYEMSITYCMETSVNFCQRPFVSDIRLFYMSREIVQKRLICWQDLNETSKCYDNMTLQKWINKSQFFFKNKQKNKISYSATFCLKCWRNRILKTGSPRSTTLWDTIINLIHYSRVDYISKNLVHFLG